MSCASGACPRNFGSDKCVGSPKCMSYCDLAHAGTCTYSGPTDLPRYSNWMAEFSARPLNTMIMVEAHHALAQLGTLDFSVPVESDLKILADLAKLENVPGLGAILNVARASLLPMWSSTQSSIVSEMLLRGVRAFDIRPYVSKLDDKLHDEHGGRGGAIEPAIEAVAQFVGNQGKTEVVFLNFQRVLSGCRDCSEKNVYAELVKVLKEHLGDCNGGVLICDANVSATVGSFAGRVIVHSTSHELVSASGVSASDRMVHHSINMYNAPWYDRNSLSELQLRMKDDDDAKSISESDTVLTAHQWILTPQTNDFLGAITQRYTAEYQDKANPHGCQSLACFGEVASAESFTEYHTELKTAGYMKSNFVLLDYADREGNMEAILKFNRQQ